uniref:MYND-type domain-containing protein n=1 Tax=Amblyomma triste TaxID=251400 RepID=A0A023G968_AMBTT
MRWVKIDTSVNGIFSREACPEDSEYLHTHMDTFKCMWHEQTRNYWARMIISLREYVRKHIFTYESLERLGAPASAFEVIIEHAYINICTNFAEDSFGQAREFLRAIINICANRDMMNQIGARPLSNDPFYNKFTRDFYRTVFGQPSSTMLKVQLQAHITLPLYSRFAAGVVALIKQWVRVTDCSLKDYFQKFHAHPYWSYPDDYCPQKYFFSYVRDKFYGWDSPEMFEVKAVMSRAPDRATSFAEVIELLSDYLDELSDISEDSEDSVCLPGNRHPSDIASGVSDQLLNEAPFHIRELCSTCMLESSDYSSDDESYDGIIPGSKEEDELCKDLNIDRKFWNQPKVKALLDAAEKRYRERLLDKMTDSVINSCYAKAAETNGKAAKTNGKAAETNNKATETSSKAASKRKGKKRKKGRNAASISNNVTTAPLSHQPAFMKNGAVPPPTPRPEIIHLEENGASAQLTATLERLKLKLENNETPSTASSQQQPGNASGMPKPQEAAKKPQKAAKELDEPSSKNVENKSLGSGDAAASKPVGSLKKVDQKLSVNGDTAASKVVEPSKKIGKKPLVNGDIAALKAAVRKCSTCSKSDGVKLKKCSLCVQKKMDPVYYCSRECQMEDWDNHQTVHMDDID